MLRYNPGLDQDCPRWVYATWAVGLFLYQTFDAVDGTQAYAGSVFKNKLGHSMTLVQAENSSEWAIRRIVRPRYA